MLVRVLTCARDTQTETETELFFGIGRAVRTKVRANVRANVRAKLRAKLRANLRANSFSYVSIGFLPVFRNVYYLCFRFQNDPAK